MLGYCRHPPDLFPDVEHAEEVDGALMISHNDTRRLESQQLRVTLEPPSDAENVGQRIHHPRP